MCSTDFMCKSQLKSKGLNTPLQMLNEQRKEKKVQSCDKWR